MNFKEYQEQAKSFALETALNEEYLVSGLAAEAGEVAGKYAKKVRDGEKGSYQKELLKEVGDVLWFAALLAEIHGVSLEDLAQENVDKLASRQARGKISGSGDNR